VDLTGMEKEQEKAFKFVTCGDLSGFDPIVELQNENDLL